MSTTETLPPVSVKLPGELVQLAKSYAAVQDRSVPKQIEHWVKIGRIAIDNPDIPYEMIERLLIAREEHRRGEVEPYDPSIFDLDPNENN